MFDRSFFESDPAVQYAGLWGVNGPSRICNVPFRDLQVPMTTRLVRSRFHDDLSATEARIARRASGYVWVLTFKRGIEVAG